MTFALRIHFLPWIFLLGLMNVPFAGLYGPPVCIRWFASRSRSDFKSNLFQRSFCCHLHVFKHILGCEPREFFFPRKQRCKVRLSINLDQRWNLWMRNCEKRCYPVRLVGNLRLDFIHHESQEALNEIHNRIFMLGPSPTGEFFVIFHDRILKMFRFIEMQWDAMSNVDNW